MTDYKFQAGQAVDMRPRRWAGQRGGSYLVVRPLPSDGGANQYRLKSKSDGHERVAAEAELSASDILPAWRR